MKMKRFTSIALASALVLSLAACGSAGNGNSSGAASGAPGSDKSSGFTYALSIGHTTAANERPADASL